MSGFFVGPALTTLNVRTRNIKNMKLEFIANSNATMSRRNSDGDNDQPGGG